MTKKRRILYHDLDTYSHIYDIITNRVVTENKELGHLTPLMHNLNDFKKIIRDWSNLVSKQHHISSMKIDVDHKTLRQFQYLASLKHMTVRQYLRYLTRCIFRRYNH